jgi:hypothetical protein
MAVLGNKFRSLLNIHADESRMASLVIGVMLLTSAGFTLGSTGIGTLFLMRYGAQYLPYMYLPLGIISLVTSLGITILLGRVRREALYIYWHCHTYHLCLDGAIQHMEVNLSHSLAWQGSY